MYTYSITTMEYRWSIGQLYVLHDVLVYVIFLTIQKKPAQLSNYDPYLRQLRPFCFFSCCKKATVLVV